MFLKTSGAQSSLKTEMTITFDKQLIFKLLLSVYSRDIYLFGLHHCSWGSVYTKVAEFQTASLCFGFSAKTR